MTLIDEFIERLNQIYGVFINMNMAYMLLSARLNELKLDNSKNIHFGEGDPNDPGTNFQLTVNIGEFKERIKKGGYDINLVSNLCIVAIYQLWEDEYRGKIAKEKGIAKNELLIDLFGDIRIIRRAIIHNKSKRFDDFDKIKKLDFMKQRDYVFLKDSEVDIIIDLIRDELTRIE